MLQTTALVFEGVRPGVQCIDNCFSKCNIHTNHLGILTERMWMCVSRPRGMRTILDF